MQCARSSPAGRASSARTSSTRSSPAATRSPSSTTSRPVAASYVNEQAQLVEHDIREPFLFDAEVVFHLAAQADVGTSVQRPGVRRRGERARHAQRAGGGARRRRSGRVLVDRRRDLRRRRCRRRRRTRRCGPCRPTGMAKLSAEAYVEGWRRVHGLRSVVLRFANVYGPRQSAALEGGVIAIFLERLEAGEETLVFGDGEQTRDFVHVDDVVRALLAAAERDGGVFNVGTGVETTVNRLHELCREASGIDAPPRHAPPRLGDARRSVLDVSRAKSELGWRPKVDLAKGLRSTWAVDAREGLRRRRAKLLAVDFPVTAAQQPPPFPWRTAALVAAVVATAELVVLLVVAGGSLISGRRPPPEGHGRLQARQDRNHKARVGRQVTPPAQTSPAAGSRSSCSTATADRAPPRPRRAGSKAAATGSASSATPPATTTRARSSCTAPASPPRASASRATSASGSCRRSTACDPDSCTARTRSSSSAGGAGYGPTHELRRIRLDLVPTLAGPRVDRLARDVERAAGYPLPTVRVERVRGVEGVVRGTHVAAGGELVQPEGDPCLRDSRAASPWRAGRAHARGRYRQHGRRPPPPRTTGRARADPATGRGGLRRRRR